MSWLVEKKGNKFRFWSTILDDWLTPWLERNEALSWLRKKKTEKLEEEMREEEVDFPFGWFGKDGRRHMNALDSPEGKEI